MPFGKMIGLVQPKTNVLPCKGSLTIKYHPTKMTRQNSIVLVFTALFLLNCQTNSINPPEGFQIHPDFDLELVASEPLVFDPVEMKFDEHGRTFVLEMPGYPLRDADSRLVQLKDSDGDGLYDQRLVYSDSLGIASSFLPYKGGFLVASPPNLLWINDNDNDHIEDERKIIMGGFSTGNLQHNFNGLTYGLDNWIYAANGGNSGKPYFEADPGKVLDLRGGDFRFDLEKQKIQRIGKSSGGFKITFDNWGHLYETHNLEHISHLVFEDRYIEDMPGSPSHALTNISNHDENGLSRIYPVGEQDTRVNHPEQSGYFSGACGITYYGGGAFPGVFDNSILVADCVLNLVHLDILSKNGSSFSAKRDRDKAEFLASSDRSFRPVNMATGPNGALYVVDIHREVIEHPEWIPDELEEKMDLNAGKEKGRIYRITPKGHKSSENRPLPSDLKKLVLLLGSDNQWTRTTAQRLLVTQNKQEAIPLLTQQLENSANPLARLHSLWTLDGLEALEKRILVSNLEDTSPEIRENAIKIAEKRLVLDSASIKPLIELTKDKDARVRMRATLALGTLPSKDHSDHIAEITEALMVLLSDTESDSWIVKSIASALQSHAFESTKIILAQNFQSLTQNHFQILDLFTELIGKEGTPDQTHQFLAALEKNKMAIGPKTKIIEALARGWQNNSHPALDNKAKDLFAISMKRIEEGNSPTLIKATAALRYAMALPPSSKMGGLIKNAMKSVFDTTLSTEERLDQLQLIGLDDFDNRKVLLYSLLDNRQPLSLQMEAINQLRSSNDRTVGAELLELWSDFGPQTRMHAANILLYKSYNHDLLLTAMENGLVNLGEFNLDLERRRVLLFSKNKETKRRAEALFSDAGVVTRKDAIENMRPALKLEGIPEKGEEVFKTTCIQCHRHGDLGIHVGPNLTEINRKSKESLLHDILDPNAAVDTGYLNYQVRAKDGSIFTGLVFNETDTKIGLRMVGGEERTFDKKDITDFSSLGTSMMFEGLELNMNLQEMADLLAFLQQSK
jgi:putative membrane-bound dehydrogenase-like protein